MTPGSRAPGVFCLQMSWPSIGTSEQAADWRGIASYVDCDLRRHRYARALRPPGRSANTHGEHFSFWHAADQFVRLLPARLDWPIHAQSPGDFAGLARGHCRRLLRRLHNVLQFRLGNREDAGGWRVGPRCRLCRRKRDRRAAPEGCRSPPVQQILIAATGTIYRVPTTRHEMKESRITSDQSAITSYEVQQ